LVRWTITPLGVVTFRFLRLGLDVLFIFPSWLGYFSLGWGGVLGDDSDISKLALFHIIRIRIGDFYY